ncbi:MAG: Ig-like domain-containing protein, partial [Tateyamaria sp.]
QSFAVDWGDGRAVETIVGPQTQLSTTYTSVGNYTISVTATDADGATSTPATASVTVNALPNTAPVAGDLTVNMNEDGTQLIVLPATDADNDPLTYSIVGGSGPTLGALDLTDLLTGEVTYSPNLNVFGTDGFTYAVDDGRGGVDTGVITINIASVNDLPVAQDQSVSTAEDTPVDVTLTATDVDTTNTGFTFAILSGPSNGSITAFDASTGVLTYAPGANYNGPDAITFSATDSDGGLGVVTGTIALNVTPVNDLPVAQDQSVSTSEDTPVDVTLTATDVDTTNTGFTFAILSGPSNGSITAFDASTGVLTYTPDADFNGPDAITFSATDSDGGLGVVTGTIALNVTPVNDAPVAQDQSVTTDEDMAVGITLTATDVDASNTSFTFEILTGPSNGLISDFNAAAGTFVYTPTGDFNGPDAITFEVRDSENLASLASGTVSLTVNPVNDPPVAQDQSVTTDEDTAVGITLTATDVDLTNADFTFEILTGPSNGTITGFSAATGVFVYTPDADFNGPDAITFQVRDSENLVSVASGTVSLTVTPVNDAPVAQDQSVSTDEDMAVGITLTATDVDASNTGFTFEIESGPLNGAVSDFNAATGVFVYTPDADFNGLDTITFSVLDSGSLMSVADGVVGINVAAVNDAPSIAIIGDAVVTEGDVVSILPQATDVDGDGLTWRLVSGPAGATVDP